MSEVTGLTRDTRTEKKVVRDKTGATFEERLTPPGPREYKGMGHSVADFRKTASRSAKSFRNKNLEMGQKVPGRRR